MIASEGRHSKALTATESRQDRELRQSACGVLVHTRAERELAVSHWLLTATDDRRLARAEWDETGIALLRCGTVFAAVRIPGAVVHAAAGAEDAKRVDAYLGGALHGGPVFIDSGSQVYYALVPASTARRWDIPDTECLGVASYLGVPSPASTDPTSNRSYWCVPMDGPGALCTPRAVSQMVMHGRFRQAGAGR